MSDKQKCKKILIIYRKNYKIGNFGSEVGQISLEKKTYAILDGWMDESMDG